MLDFCQATSQLSMQFFLMAVSQLAAQTVVNVYKNSIQDHLLFSFINVIFLILPWILP